MPKLSDIRQDHPDIPRLRANTDKDDTVFRGKSATQSPKAIPYFK